MRKHVKNIKKAMNRFIGFREWLDSIPDEIDEETAVVVEPADVPRFVADLARGVIE